MMSIAGLRSRISPVIGDTVARVYFKDEMIELLYSNKANKHDHDDDDMFYNHKKQVRFAVED
jgi:hypothetical protein